MRNRFTHIDQEETDLENVEETKEKASVTRLRRFKNLISTLAIQQRIKKKLNGYVTSVRSKFWIGNSGLSITLGCYIGKRIWDKFNIVYCIRLANGMLKVPDGSNQCIPYNSNLGVTWDDLFTGGLTVFSLSFNLYQVYRRSSYGLNLQNLTPEDAAELKSVVPISDENSMHAASAMVAIHIDQTLSILNDRYTAYTFLVGARQIKNHSQLSIFTDVAKLSIAEFLGCPDLLTKSNERNKRNPR